MYKSIYRLYIFDTRFIVSNFKGNTIHLKPTKQFTSSHQKV